MGGSIPGRPSGPSELPLHDPVREPGVGEVLWVKVTEYVRRDIPICPKCRVVMIRRDSNGLTGYYRCRECNARCKSRDRRIEP